MSLLNKLPYTFYLVLVLVALQGCDESRVKRVLPESAGDLGGVLVVMDDFEWKGSVGNAIRDELSDELYGSPQNENIFNLKHVPRSKFKGLLKLYKNIIYLDDSDDSSAVNIAFKRDVWAKDQMVVQIREMNYAKVKAILNENKEKILFEFKQNEIRGLQRRQYKAISKEIKELLPIKFGVTLNITDGFEIAKDTPGFVWLRSERQRSKSGTVHQISLGIMVYELPIDNLNDFAKKAVLMKDSVNRVHISTSAEGSYMRIYHDYDPAVKEILYNGNDAVEIRGLWKMEHDFMGGPFLTYAILNKEKTKVVFIDGYAFAPGFDKKGFLMELEAMMKTLE